MHAYLRRLRPFWPQGLLLLGGGIVVHTMLAVGQAQERERFVRAQHWGLNSFHIPLHRTNADQAIKLATTLGAEAAFDLCESFEIRSKRYDRSDRVFDVLRARIRAETSAAPDSELRSFIRPRQDEGVWLFAFEQLLDLRKSRGDRRGAIALLSDLAFRRIDHPELHKIPFPYFEHWAALEASKLHQQLGEGEEAYQWALLAKHRWPVRYLQFTCSTNLDALHDEVESLLQSTAQQAGRRYEPEPFNYERYCRKTIGPGWAEATLRAGLGFLLVILALVRLRAPEYAGSVLLTSGRFFWKRRGCVAKVGLGCYAAGFAGCMILVAKGISGFPPTPTERLWLGLLSLVLCAVLVPFLGCFVGHTSDRMPTFDRPSHPGSAGVEYPGSPIMGLERRST